MEEIKINFLIKNELLNGCTYHFTFIWVIEPFQQLNTGAFPTATAPNKCQSLPRFHRHSQIIQHLDIWPSWVGELAVSKLYFTFEVVLRRNHWAQSFQSTIKPISIIPPY